MEQALALRRVDDLARRLRTPEHRSSPTRCCCAALFDGRFADARR
jgi:hypothetical protein